MEQKITANPHTLEEVIQYLKDTYSAVEVSKQSHNYREQRKELKESLILQHKPELLGELAEIERPINHNQETLQQFFKQLGRISKDVHLYYGVTEEDIQKKTKRYSVLVTTLCL